MRLDWKAWVGILLTIFLLWWVFRGQDPAALWREVAGADFGLLALAVAMATATHLLKALRWKLLLAPLEPSTSLGNRFSAVSIGAMANNVIGMRSGEFARAFAVSRTEPVSASGAFGSLVVERFLDAVVLLGLVFFVVLEPSFPAAGAEGDVGVLITGTTRVVAVLLAGLLVVVAFPGPIVRWLEALVARSDSAFAHRIVGALESFLDGIAILRRPRLLTAALVWTLAVWVWNSLAFMVGARAFGMDVDLLGALFLNSIVAFAVALPAAPGFIGTFHYGVNLSLATVHGFGEAPANAFAIAFHFGGFLPITVIGLAYAWGLGLSVADLGRSEDAVEAELEEIPVGGAKSSDRGQGDPGVESAGSGGG